MAFKNSLNGVLHIVILAEKLSGRVLKGCRVPWEEDKLVRVVVGSRAWLAVTDHVTFVIVAFIIFLPRG